MRKDGNVKFNVNITTVCWFSQRVCLLQFIYGSWKTTFAVIRTYFNRPVVCRCHTLQSRDSFHTEPLHEGQRSAVLRAREGVSEAKIFQMFSNYILFCKLCYDIMTDFQQICYLIFSRKI